MLFIAHRGNINGPDIINENTIIQINKALKIGYDVEIDIWKINNIIYLGHDSPNYQINNNFLLNNKIWCHAKNIEALEYCIENNIQCFSHDIDDYTITSSGYIWCYPGKKLAKNSICVMPELSNNTIDFTIPYAICTDYVIKYEKIYNKFINNGNNST
jgi:hypothetical protein